MDKIAEKLEKIYQTLEKQNEVTIKILAVIQKPDNPFFRVLTIAGIGVSILGIIQIIDTIFKWF